MCLLHCYVVHPRECLFDWMEQARSLDLVMAPKGSIGSLDYDDLL